MANEHTADAPLGAPLADRLREKDRLEDARAAERAAGEAVERHVERRKAEEREAAMRHAAAAPVRAAGGKGTRPPRAGEREGHARWGVLAGGLALLGGIVALRRLVGRR